MKMEFIKKHYTHVLLAILILGVSLSNVVWLSKNKIIEREEAKNLIRSVDYRNILYSDGRLKDKIELITATYKTKPHYSFLYYLLPAFFPVNKDFYANFARGFNIIYLALIAYFVYRLADRLFKNRQIALLSSYVALSIPIIFSLSRFFIPTIALIFFTVLCVYLLFKSQEFNNKSYAWLFFISLLIAHTVANFIMYYIMIPFLFVLVRKYIWERRRYKKINLYNLLIFSTLVIASWSFYKNYAIDIHWTLCRLVLKNEILPRTLKYIEILINDQIFLINFIFLVIGLIISIRRHMMKLIILIAAMLPAVLSMYMHDADAYVRFTAPFTVFYALFICFWVIKINNKFIRKALTIFIIFISFFTFIKVSYGFLDGVIGDSYRIESHCNNKKLYICLFDHVLWTEAYPVGNIWPCKKIADDISGECAKDEGRILIVPDIEGLNYDIVNYYMSLNNNALEMSYFWDYTLDFYILLFNSKYVFLKDGPIIENVWHIDMIKERRIEKFIKDKPGHFMSNFIILATYTLPDGSTGYLCKNNNLLLFQRPVGERIEILEEALNYSPESIIARILLFRAYTQTNDIKRAKLELVKCSRILNRVGSLSVVDRNRICPYYLYLSNLTHMSIRSLKGIPVIDQLNKESKFFIIEQLLLYGNR